MISHIRNIFLWSSFIPFLFFSDGYLFILVITMCSLFFVFGTFVSIPNFNKRNDHSLIKLKNKKLLILLPILYFLLKQGYILETFDSLISGDFFELSIERTRDRYDYNISHGALFNIGSSIFFLYTFINGLCHRGFLNKNFIIILIMILIEISSLAKLSILIGGITYFIGFVLKNRGLKVKSNFKSFFLIPLGLVLSVSVLMVVQFFRVKEKSDALEIILFNKLPVYTISHYKACQIWFDNMYMNTNMGYGYYTFSSIYKLFGYQFPQGFYKPINTIYGVTNVYTIYRNILSDIPLPFVFVLFFLIGLGINNISKKSINYFDVILFMIVIPFALFPFNSIFIFTTYSLFTVMSIFVIRIKKF
jgi:oligosaccharide repeat unit polymerase